MDKHNELSRIETEIKNLTKRLGAAGKANANSAWGTILRLNKLAARRDAIKAAK